MTLISLMASGTVTLIVEPLPLYFDILINPVQVRKYGHFGDLPFVLCFVILDVLPYDSLSRIGHHNPIIATRQ